MHTKKIWLLTDSRAGNANQARHLATLMQWDAQEHFLKYSLLGSLPNSIPLGLSRLSHKCRNELLNNQVPDIIISSGRRTAAVAVAIKSLHPATSIVQIMHPELPSEQFSAIILPLHDKKTTYLHQKNIIWVSGALSHVDRNYLEEERKKLYAHYDLAESTIIYSIFIGGTSGSYSITKENIDEIFNTSLKSALTEKALILVSTSRRTKPNIIEYIKSKASNSSKVKIMVYSYDPKSEYNPYWGMVAAAARVVVTADSISMCSDIINCGKQLFVYGRKNMLSNKHQKFMQTLLQNNQAKNLAFGMQPYKVNVIEQTKPVVEQLNKLLSL